MGTKYRAASSGQVGHLNHEYTGGLTLTPNKKHEFGHDLQISINILRSTMSYTGGERLVWKNTSQSPLSAACRLGYIVLIGSAEDAQDNISILDYLIIALVDNKKRELPHPVEVRLKQMKPKENKCA